MVNQGLTLVLMSKRAGSPAAALRAKQGAKIKQYRKFSGLSQAALGDAVGVSKAAVSQWENGESSPRPHLQIEIAKALHFPWNVVFGLDQETAA